MTRQYFKHIAIILVIGLSLVFTSSAFGYVKGIYRPTEKWIEGESRQLLLGNPNELEELEWYHPPEESETQQDERYENYR